MNCFENYAKENTERDWKMSEANRCICFAIGSKEKKWSVFCNGGVWRTRNYFCLTKDHTCKLFNVFIQFSISIIYRGLINIFKTKCKRVLWSEPKLAWAKLESIIHTLPILNIAQWVIDMFFWHFEEISSCVLRNYQGLPVHLIYRLLRATWT